MVCKKEKINLAKIREDFVEYVFDINNKEHTVYLQKNGLFSKQCAMGYIPSGSASYFGVANKNYDFSLEQITNRQDDLSQPNVYLSYDYSATTRAICHSIGMMFEESCLYDKKLNHKISYSDYVKVECEMDKVVLTIGADNLPNSTQMIKKYFKEYNPEGQWRNGEYFIILTVDHQFLKKEICDYLDRTYSYVHSHGSYIRWDKR